MLVHIPGKRVFEARQVKASTLQMWVNGRELDRHAALSGAHVEKTSIAIPRKFSREHLRGDQASCGHSIEKKLLLASVRIKTGIAVGSERTLRFACDERPCELAPVLVVPRIEML